MENKVKIAKERFLGHLNELIESNKRIIEIQEKLIETYDVLIALRKKETQN